MSFHKNRISVVIRAKNEEFWLNSCLFAVANQDYPDIEIIIVDNESTDQTVAIAQSFGCRILTITDEQFNFSRALNMGIEAASGELIAMVSGHCIPIDDQWLARLAMHFRNKNIVATYGRQEPMPDSHPSDKRDLWTTFGEDRKLQNRDYFFHNANSMIRRDAWKELPFSEAIHGVEDRDWAKKIMRQGFQIIYEPTARVFHHHGIHHTANEERTARVVRVIELIQQDLT